METYARHTLTALNALLKDMRIVSKKFTSLWQVTPEIVKSFAEYHFGHKTENLIQFLESHLNISLGHLQTRAFDKGDLFNCLSLMEIIYNLIRQESGNTLPPYPLFTEEVVNLMLNKRDIMAAHAAWLAEHQQVNPQGLIDAGILQDQYVQNDIQNPSSSRRSRLTQSSRIENGKAHFNTQGAVSSSSPNQAQDDLIIDIDALFAQYIIPLINKYYAPYQNEREVRYTTDRLYRKLQKQVKDAVASRQFDIYKFNQELDVLIKHEMKEAIRVEKMNLVDEARWRRDEREYTRKEAQRIIDGVMSRRNNEEALKREQRERDLKRIAELRQEELEYVKAQRKEEEKSIFLRLGYQIANMVNKKPLDPDLYAAEMRKQIHKRMRVYAGPEREILEQNGHHVYRQRVLNGYVQKKNLEENLVD